MPSPSARRQCTRGIQLALLPAFALLSGCAALKAPDLTSPSLQEFTAAGPMILEWAGAPKATFTIDFEDQVTRDTKRESVSKPTIDLEPMFRSGQLSYGRTYSYKVTQRVGEEDSPASSTGSFRIEAFASPACEPRELEVDRKIQLRWSGVDGAPAYAIQVAGSPDFETTGDTPIVVDARVQRAEYDLQPSVDADRVGIEQPMYYRVAVAASTTMGTPLLGEWSQGYQLKVLQPEVATLEDVVADDPNDPVILRWTPGPNTSDFRLEIFDSEKTSGSPIVRTTALDTSDYDATALRSSGRLKFGNDYYYRVLARVPGISSPLATELKLLRVDIKAPTPVAPNGDLDGDPLPPFQWSKPDIEDCRFEVWIGRTRNTDAAWKRFVTEIGEEALSWTWQQYNAAFRQYTGAAGRGANSLLKSGEPEFFAYEKQYYWRIRTIYEDENGRTQRGKWTDWVRFVVRRSPPSVTRDEVSAKRTTPVIEWEESNWERKRPLVARIEVEIVPATSQFSGQPEDIVAIDPSQVVDGRNRIRLSKRLTPGVSYKWRIRTVYKQGNQASNWAEAGTVALPTQPTEQFPIGQIDKTEAIQEWTPALSHDFTKLAYQAGMPGDDPTFADAVMRSGEGTQNAGSIFTKELTHDERGMPLPNPARGTFIESWERGARITFLQPSWTTGDRLFFASNQYDTLSYLRLSIMSRALDAPAQTAVLTASSDESVLYPDVSRDGKRICFTVAKINRTKIKDVESYYESGTNAPEKLAQARQDLEGDITYEIWTARTDGAGKTFLTRGKSGVFNNDGTKLAFLARTRPGAPWGLWTCSARGGSLSQIVPPPPNGRIMEPRWSNDGTKIAYVSDQTGNDDIWVYDVKTGKQTQVTRVLDDDRCPVWGKADKYIMFVSYREGGFDLYYVDVSSI